MQKKITAQDIANYLISYSQEQKLAITPLELQKFLFYAQGWHLAVSDESLFDDNFEAWVHGPVIKKIYGKFKKFEGQNIEEHVETPKLPIDLIAFLKKFVIDKYYHLGAADLWKMVHHEKAYKIARGDLPNDKPSSNKLDEAIIRESFKERYDKNVDEIDEIDDELLEEILESREKFRSGDKETYEEVFGHPQPGF